MSGGIAGLASAASASFRRRNRKYTFATVATFAIALLAFFVFSSPASSLSESAFCGKAEHEHSSGCYASELICGESAEEDRAEAHIHSDSCYIVEKGLICALDQDDASDSLMPDDALAGDEENAVSPDGGDPEVLSEADVHVHSESCYQEASKLACGLEAGVVNAGNGHAHSDACYKQVLNCDLEEHSHVLSCYSNPEADVETSSNWELTLPEADALTGMWADGLLAVAESQLGYSESEKNYVVAEDGKTKGYTRYGAWYGDAYGDWCAMFVSFCLNYADIPEESVPREANCQKWIEALAGEDYQMYYPVGTYAELTAEVIASGEATLDNSGVPIEVLEYYVPSEPFQPVMGDIVFFNWDYDPDADHVGIVIEVIEASETESAKLKTIEGNASDVVKYCEYDLDDASIMGYAALPMNMVDDGASSAQASAYSASSSGARVVGVADGSKAYQSGSKLYYQTAYHTIGGGIVNTFALIPVQDGYSASELANYEYTSGNWTARSGANFTVAYCADLDTSYSTKGAEYTIYRLNNSRIASEASRQILATIVANTYPFISADEMKAAMSAAGVQGVEDCCESELIAASQQAIWMTANPTSDHSGEGYSTTADYYKDICVNPLSSDGVGDDHKHGSHIPAIRDYLLGLEYLADLEVASWVPVITEDADGLINLSVDVSLNREVLAEENVVVRLAAGGKSSSSVKLAESARSFELNVNGLTADELATAEAQILVDGMRVQAYFYDSGTYQDLIGGNWENYSYDLSFAIGSGETSVSVSKVWEDGNPGTSSVSMQLLANGVTYGPAVSLGFDNDWTYTWSDLPKYDLLGSEIEYTVVEDVSSGFVAKAEVSAAASSGKMWRKLSGGESFVAGGKYLLMFPSGALAWLKDSTVSNSAGVLGWERVSLMNTTSILPAALWQAEVDTASGGVALRNVGKDRRIYLNGSTIKFDPYNFYTAPTTYSDGCLKINGKYLSNINTNGNGVAVDEPSAALPLEVYELVDAAGSQSEINYTITNYKADPASDPVSVSVEKAWAGGGDHPESVTVHLLQDGVRYGIPVELNAGNNWSHMWENLPAKLASNSSEIEYSVEEISVEGYTSTVTTKGDKYSYLITNTPDVELGSISILKVSSSDESKTLQGAEFDLYCVDASGSSMPELGISEPVLKFNDTALATDADGLVRVANVEIGKNYYLVETKSPEGCNQLSCAIRFTVKGAGFAPEIKVDADAEGAAWAKVSDSDRSVLRVSNEEVYALPETGGIGLFVFAAGGAALIALGAAGLWARGRNR